jgi:hypothetical protein
VGFQAINKNVLQNSGIDGAGPLLAMEEPHIPHGAPMREIFRY